MPVEFYERVVEQGLLPILEGVVEIFEPHVFATSLATLVVIQDPVGAIPIFLSLTGKQSDAQRKRSARTATLVSLGVILVFALAGRYILEFLGISVPALQLSGGLLLLLVALELLTDKMDEHPDPDATGGVTQPSAPRHAPTGWARCDCGRHGGS